MLARTLTAILFAEMFLYCGYAVARVALGEWPPGFAIVFILGMPVLVRGVLVLASFALAWLWRTPRPESGHIGFAAAVALFLREWAGVTFQYGFGQAFETAFTQPDRLVQVASDETPLLLVHGYCCNRGVWWWLKPRLERAGHVVATISLEPVLGDIDDNALPLSERIEEICRLTGASKVTLVTHSMGGLTVRAYLRACGSERIARVVTICAPHHGSRHAALGLGVNARQMRPGSPWVEALAQTALPESVDVVSIYSLHDDLVAPQNSGALEGARCVPLAGVGHLDALASRRVLDSLLAALGGGRSAAESAIRSKSPASTV